MNRQDYYNWALSELGYGEVLSEKELTTRYRQASKKYHPDLNPGIDEEYFKALASAYDDMKKNKVKNGVPKAKKTAKKQTEQKKRNLTELSLNELYQLQMELKNDANHFHREYYRYDEQLREMVLQEDKVHKQLINLRNQYLGMKDYDSYAPFLLILYGLALSSTFDRIKEKDLSPKAIQGYIYTGVLVSLVGACFLNPISTVAMITLFGISGVRAVLNNKLNNEIDSVVKKMEETEENLELKHQESSEVYGKRETARTCYLQKMRNLQFVNAEIDRRMENADKTSSYEQEKKTEKGYQYHK